MNKMKNKYFKRIYIVIAFLFLNIVGISFGFYLFNKKEVFLAANNCRMVNGREVCSDCDAHNRSDPAGRPNLEPDPSKKKCWTKASQCTKVGAVLAYYSDGTCGCVDCPTCNSTPDPDPDPIPPCIDSTSTSYSLSCPKSKIYQGEISSCTCTTKITHTCNTYNNSTSNSSISISSDTCGQKVIDCGDQKAYVDVLCPACYRKSEKEGSYDYIWAYEDPGKGYSKISNIISKDKCELTNSKVNTCSSSVVSSGENGELLYCDSHISLNAGKTDKCNNFYEITCPNSKNTVTTDFSNENVEIKVGQGFSLKAKVTLVTECTGTFMVDKWNNEYDKLNKLIERAEAAGDAREKNWYQNISNELVGIVNSYRNAMVEYSSTSANVDRNNPIGTVKLLLKDKVVNTYNFELDNANRKIYVDYSPTKKYKLANDMIVNDFTSKKTSIVDLQPPQVYLNKYGEIVSSTSNDKIDGGHLFYTPMNLEAGNYSLQAFISKLGSEQNSTVSNKQCSVKLIDNDIDYRIIDVDNPFGITTLTPGINWSNENYNFKNTINKETWSSNSLYRIKLDHDTLKTIQSENQSAIREKLSPYTGLCQSIESGKINPYNKSKVCDLIK